MTAQTWVVVVNGAKGRIYEQDSSSAGLTPIADGEFTGDKRRSRDINSDRNGRKPHHTNMSMAESVDDPQTVLKRRFMHSIGQFLEKARNEHRFGKLILIAPPQMLGLLRNELSSSLADQVVVEINKDLTDESAAMIKQRLEAPHREEEERQRRLEDDRRLGRGA